MRNAYLVRLPLITCLVCFGSKILLAQHMNASPNPCQSVGPNSSETACFLAASKAADLDLNNYYGTLRAHLDRESFRSLQVAQRLWVQFRDANCAAEYTLYEGGSAGPTVRAACMEAVTQERTKELKIMYGWTLEK
jgi:uncharacterized protein YecT (DUF1311 family)